jgi:hypothetical protein
MTATPLGRDQQIPPHRFTTEENVMTHALPRIIAATASGLAGCLLLAACGNSSSTTHANTAANATHDNTTNSPAAASPSATGTAATTTHPSDAPQPVTAAATACSLITEQDVTNTVGADPGKGGADNRQGATACAYGSYPNQVLTVNVLPTRGRAGYHRVRHDPRLTNATGTRVATVAGLGDQAFELSGPHADVIYFTKDDALIVIGFTAPTSPTKGAALTLAKIAVGRL